MKLKRVEILGFKSFADKTVIEFHEGITCFVGPNGCGKSNIGEAIRWVLGEQSAKSLRGGKMPDVIFSGASSKKPLNFAEVTITFSDVQGTLPLDYEEVAITRRLHRSGESEYFINKEAVRLKDVHSLFLDSGIGKSNFSFFEQGKIDQLIQYSPEERRSIFEEAAGIVRFLQRKRETIRKLEETGLNLSRVEDVKGEIDKQIELLEDQARAAVIYKEKKGQLEAFEKEHLALRYQSYAKKKGELVLKESEARKKYRELVGEKESYEWGLGQKKGAYDELEGAYRGSRDEMFMMKSERELKTQLKTQSDTRIKELAASSTKMASELKQLDLESSGWLAEIRRLKEKKEVLGSDLNAASLALSTKKEEFKGLEKELVLLQKKLAEAYREKGQAFQKQTSLKSEVKQMIYRVETNLEKKEQFEGRSSMLVQLMGEKEQEVHLKKEALQIGEDGVRAVEQKFHEIEERLKICFEEVKTAKVFLDGVMREFHEKGAKLKALMHLRQEFSGFTGGGKKLLQESGIPKSPLYCLLKGLYEYITPQAGYEQAVSTVLRAYVETLVVNTQKDLATVLTFAKEHQLTGFSLICLESVPSCNSSLFVQSNPLGHYLFRFLSCAECQEQAFAKAFLKGEASWLADGVYIDEKGVLFLGGAKESSVFLREAEIKALEKEIEGLNQKKAKGDAKLQEAMSAENEEQKKKAEAESLRRKAALALAEARFTVQKTEGELEQLTREKQQVDEEVNALLNLIQGLLDEQQKVLKSSKCADVDLDKIQKDLTAIESALAAKSELTNEKRDALQEEERKLAQLDSDYRKTTHQYQLLEAKNEETERLITRLKNDLEESKKGEVEWGHRLHSNTADLAHLNTGLEALQKQVAEIEHKRQVSKEALQADETHLKEVEKQLKEMENKLHQIGIQLAHVETGQNAVLVGMQESPLEPRLNILQDQIEREIKNLKTFLDQNQNVNLAAIEECDKQKGRKAFLEEQIEDLTQAKAGLLKMMAGLDEESRQAFNATFRAVRSNFQKNFAILFQGGEADLELVEAEDVLEAGIEITAKPPGKYMRSLSLLSGGEKCLTAMALLFAIFEVKAAPFCILDEIDAPLDDANVERFLNVVKQFIDRSQFIIVTHNKRTMALADRLYGVSMEDKGISKLLFMEFKTNQLIGV